MLTKSFCHNSLIIIWIKKTLLIVLFYDQNIYKESFLKTENRFLSVNTICCNWPNSFRQDYRVVISVSTKKQSVHITVVSWQAVPCTLKETLHCILLDKSFSKSTASIFNIFVIFGTKRRNPLLTAGTHTLLVLVALMSSDPLWYCMSFYSFSNLINKRTLYSKVVIKYKSADPGIDRIPGNNKFIK